MRIAQRLLLCLPLAVALVADGAASQGASATMARAADQFLGSLTPEQRAKAVFEFAHAERLNWHFIPRERRGLPFKEMTEPQRALARTLLQTGTGERGLKKVDAIIGLELVLRELGGSPTMRDPEMYFFSIFGRPSASQTWGWRAEGHHLSLNFTVSAARVATAPSFFGANPANVTTGSQKGVRALAEEEDLGRALMLSLDESQRGVALLPIPAPKDILTMNTVDIDPLTPVGISTARFTREQSAGFLRLVDAYLARMAPDVAAARRTALQKTDFASVTFAWAGSTEVGQPHYYRVQGPSFLIEYDNTQNNANHIHSVWRDFKGDFGRDLMREHYLTAPPDHGHQHR